MDVDLITWCDQSPLGRGELVAEEFPALPNRFNGGVKDRGLSSRWESYSAGGNEGGDSESVSASLSCPLKLFLLSFFSSLGIGMAEKARCLFAGNERVDSYPSPCHSYHEISGPLQKKNIMTVGPSKAPRRPNGR